MPAQPFQLHQHDLLLSGVIKSQGGEGREAGRIWCPCTPGPPGRPPNSRG